MNKQTQALKLALEALESDLLDMVLNPDGHMVFRKDQAITAIREALAEHPAQQQELPACISCGAAPTRYVDEDTELPGTYCDNCGPGGVPAQQQEPVAIVEVVVPHLESIVVKHILDAPFPKVGDFFYTSPPASKPWVGLTDVQIGQVLDDPNIAEPHQGHWRVLPFAFARAIEAKLREKNA